MHFLMTTIKAQEPTPRNDLIHTNRVSSRNFILGGGGGIWITWPREGRLHNYNILGGGGGSELFGGEASPVPNPE